MHLILEEGNRGGRGEDGNSLGVVAVDLWIVILSIVRTSPR